MTTRLARRLGPRGLSSLDALRDLERTLVEFYSRQRGRFALSVLLSLVDWLSGAAATWVALGCDAVPIVCGPGDVAMTNRQIVHGSFPNESPDARITINFGFHRRSSVLGVMGAGIHARSVVYDEARIRERSRVIGYAIDARRQRFPDESPYEYRPFVESGDTFRWDDHAKAGLKDYNLLDLSI